MEGGSSLQVLCVHACFLNFIDSFIHSNILHASNSNSDFKSVSLAQQQVNRLSMCSRSWLQKKVTTADEERPPLPASVPDGDIEVNTDVENSWCISR